MENLKIDEKLDLRGVICPINFIKTKLKLEEMQSGQLLELLLDNNESIKNVPSSVKEEGHKIIKVEKINDAFKLVIKKNLVEDKNVLY